MPALILLALTQLGNLAAQTSPAALGSLVVERFRTAAPESFAEVYPFAEGRAAQALTHQMKLARTEALARVIAEQGNQAVLLLSAHGRTPNSGDDVHLATELAGLYKAVKQEQAWKLVERLPIDHGNRIIAHELDVTIVPDWGLRVTDRISVEVRGGYGWTAFLNNNARIRSVTVNGKPARHEFGASLLWIDVPKAAKAELRIGYELEVEKGPNNTNSGCFLEHAGHVRNQYGWHPFFGFGNPTGEAGFRITARIPAAYQLTTSLPQTQTQNGGTRMVRGATIRNTAALTLSYDRDWQPQRVTAGKTVLEIFATPDFKPLPSEIAAEYRRSYDLLEERFGAPSGGYFAVVQGRSRGGSGWHNLANQAAFAGAQGGPFYVAGEAPRASFIHEIAHAWTAGAAPADHLLTEGWSTFAEAILLNQRFGETTARKFWELQARLYFGRHDGNSLLLSDPRNSGVAYFKGAWIFRMLEQRLGRSKFDAAMAQFSRASLQRPATAEEFLAVFDRAQPGTARALRPYIEESRAPQVAARIDGTRVLLEQTGTPFPLTLELEIETGNGRHRKTVDLDAKTASIDAGAIVHSVMVDPDWKLLLNPKSRSPFR